MLEQRCKGGISGRSQTPQERLLHLPQPACPKQRPWLCFEGGSPAKFAARAFDFSDMSYPSPSRFPRYCEAAKLPLPEGRCTLHPCHQGEAPCCCCSKQWRGDVLPTPEISPGSYFCQLTDIPFLNRQQSEFCTGFWGYFAGGGGKGEAEGLFFFLQEEQLRQACLKLKWQHKGA